MLSTQNTFVFPIPLQSGPQFGFVNPILGAVPNPFVMKAEPRKQLQTPIPMSSLSPRIKSEGFLTPEMLLANFIRDQSEKTMLKSLNQSLAQQVKTLYSECDILRDRIKQCEEKSMQTALQQSKNFRIKIKRQRRLANQIIRLYQCPDTNCKKSYGSEFSLHQHCKAKHPEKLTS